MSRRRGRGRRFVVGLLGGIASGKSTVAAGLAACGAEVIDADAIAHRCLDRAQIRGRVRDAFGGEVLRPDGSVDRAALAARAFASEEARATLEGIVHPSVRREIEARLAAPGPEIVVLDAPLLEEAGLAGSCDAILFVDASRALREARAAARGWSPEELRRREAHQAPTRAKRGMAQFVLPNDGPRSRLRLEVRRIHALLLEQARARGAPLLSPVRRLRPGSRAAATPRPDGAGRSPRTGDRS